MGLLHLLVSIHAPTRGATVIVCPDGDLYQVSIHAPTRGATPTGNFHQFARRGFNPRPHEGGDLKVDFAISDLLSFNPRPHEGGDPDIRLWQGAA